ncbi:MAG: T9SS type A sorting domain-containing protein [Flavobacterium sp.]|nr:T9SS type A sorting domain-containing protein [Flavobacterium sp.]
MKYNFTLLCCLAFFNLSLAQTLDATKIELNYHADSDPQNLTSFLSGFFFTATDGYFKKFGRELWHSDGTKEGTFMVKDIMQGQKSSDPNSLTKVGNILFFTAYEAVHGSELWKSDGTETGTSMVKDIRPNNNDTYNGPINLIDLNGVVYFTATNGINGYELWKSDGTEAGTVMIKDINPKGDSSPANLFVFNNSIYFIANDGTNGIELWKSDGTESGTIMLKNLNQNYSGINIGNQFLILNGNFYFFANDMNYGSELWRSDGTETGTSMVKDIRVGPNSSATLLKGSLLNGIIIFEANDGINGVEIWKSDGTASGTSMIKNINNTNLSSISYNSKYIKFNNEVYFLVNNNVYGTEIWKTDGTLNGTTMLKALVSIEKFHVDNINNKLIFFSTSTNSSNRTLWSSDGTPTGTIELSNVRDSNISGLVESFVTINNSTILTGENDENGNELWITDGTITGTSFFADLNYSDSSNASKFTNVDGNLFFRARGKEYGSQLFKSDGTIKGTQLIKDINPGYDCIDNLSDMKAINGTLFFSAADGVHGYELWKSDGTEKGTDIVKDIYPGNKSSMRNYNDKQPFTVLNNILYFYADDGVHGFELWRSDGTDSGTYMIKDIHIDPQYSYGSYPREFVLLNNIIYFIAGDNTGTALWKTDGTSTGTIKVINLNDIRVLKAVNNKLIIFAETSGTTYGPHDLWASDGTAFGTNHIKTFGDNIDSDIQFSTTLKNELYFVAKSPVSYRKAIYKTDGTIGGTVILFDGANHPTMPGLDINNIITCGSYVYFVADDSYGTSKELWRTNGKTTEKIAGPDTANFLYIRNLTCYNNNLLYLAESWPYKIWAINDNLSKPLELNINILNGPNFGGYSSIEELGATSNNLYFKARNDVSGNELYVTKINASILGVTDYNTSKNKDAKFVTIYPNPSNELATIKSITNATILKFEVWDLSGKSIHSQLNKDLNKEIKYDTSKLNEGIYFMKTILSDGKIDNFKFMVNH